MFFATGKGLVTFSMYIMGIAVAILSAFILSRTVLRARMPPSISSCPLPPADRKSLFLHAVDKESVISSSRRHTDLRHDHCRLVLSIFDFLSGC
jgi:hypothetical protein